jgi:hypothetical protein
VHVTADLCRAVRVRSVSEVTPAFAPLTDMYIAMLLGPDVPPWQMRWARRPGIAPPNTFGALSIATPTHHLGTSCGFQPPAANPRITLSALNRLIAPSPCVLQCFANEAEYNFNQYADMLQGGGGQGGQVCLCGINPRTGQFVPGWGCEGARV